MKKIELLLKSARYIPIIAMIVAIALAIARAAVVQATGTYNPYDASPF